MNKVILIGNLGDDAELRYSQSGAPRLTFRLATSERYKRNDGQWVDHTEWHSCVIWGKRAESLSKNLTKGRQVAVEGKNKTSKFSGKDGAPRYKTEVNISDLTLLSGGRPDRQQDSRPSHDERRDADDLPF